MSFFRKITQGLGIGTAKAELDVPSQIPEGAKDIQGKVIITAQSDQKVKSIKVALVEKSVIVQGDTRREITKDLESVVLTEAFEIKKDEVRTVPFTLPVNLGNKTSIELFGGTLEITGATNNVPQNYDIVATVDLEGVALDPSASRTVSH